MKTFDEIFEERARKILHIREDIEDNSHQREPVFDEEIERLKRVVVRDIFDKCLLDEVAGGKMSLAGEILSKLNE